MSDISCDLSGKSNVSDHVEPDILNLLLSYFEFIFSQVYYIDKFAKAIVLFFLRSNLSVKYSLNPFFI